MACSATPTEGVWQYTGEDTFDFSDCDGDPDASWSYPEGQTALTLSLNENGFSASGVLLEQDVDCTLIGLNYDCDLGELARGDLDWSQDQDQPFNAVTTSGQSLSISFNNATTGEVLWKVKESCSGDECGDLADTFGFQFCDYSRTYTIQHEDAAKD